MKPNQSLYDDEKLFKEYFAAIVAGRGNSLDDENMSDYATAASEMVSKHRERFSK